MTTIHSLSATNGRTLSKVFWRNNNDTIEMSSYPRVRNFTSIEEHINTIQDFYDCITKHAAEGNCLLKGLLDRPLFNESRAGHTSAGTPTNWMVLDIDHLDQIPHQEFMKFIGLDDVSYIVQHSASSGILPGKNSYHIIVLLEKHYDPSILKIFLKHWNLCIPEFRAEFSLTRTNCSLRWPLDISVCQNDKLIYIAPPVLGPGITSSISQRIELVENSLSHANLGGLITQISDAPTEEQQLINQLRTAKGLSKKSTSFKTAYDQEVLSNPDEATITEMKEDRDFVRMNLNGGDSWGYYHPICSPEILYNFKGEPNYLIEELLPAYYPEAKKRAKESRKAHEHEDNLHRQQQETQKLIARGERIYYAFRERKEDKYYVGYYEPAANTHDFNNTSSKQKAAEYLIQHGLKRPKIIETWDYQFVPANDAVFDPDNLFINQFIRSIYMTDASAVETPCVPPNIGRVIQHVLANDPKMVEHFLNWLAVIFQLRCRTQTAWIFQGTTGTGKGILVNQIIKPLLGSDYCRTVTLENMEDQFNAHLDQCLLLNVDEVDTDQVRKMPKLMAQLKNMITEPKLSIRAMRTDLTESPNHLNIIMCSNQPNSMRIEQNDRRFNVCPRQENKLLAPGEKYTDLEAAVHGELQDFANYLKSRTADRQTASTPIENDAKLLLQEITQTAAEEVATALKKGDLGYFVDQRPTKGEPPQFVNFDGDHHYCKKEYEDILRDALLAVTAGNPVVLQHHQLAILFGYLAGNMPTTKVKLTKRLGHLGLHIAPHTIDGSNKRGLKVIWKGSAEDCDQWKKSLEQDAA